MKHQHLYRLLQPGNPEPAAWIWRGVHHTIVASGIGLMLALTVEDWQLAYGDALSAAFDVVAAFFVCEYLLRLLVAPGAPGGEHRGAAKSRLSWATSLGGVYDLLAAIPGLIALPDSRDATLIG